MNKTPTFNLKAVIRLTGLSADSLRAWERRYNLPAPERTPGGQRIYSQRDIDTIQWLIAKQSEGISISNSVSLWNELIHKGTDPLEEDRLFSSIQSANFPIGKMDFSLNSLRDQWKDACLDFNEILADQVTNRAFALTSPETVCNEIFMKGLVEIGQKWFEGEVTVQQEHFTSGVAHRRLNTLISFMPPPNRKETIVMCCPPGEEHTFANTYLTFLLRRQGYKVIDLGAQVPLEKLKETILKIQPQLVVLSAQNLFNAAQLKRSAQTLANTTPIGFGGRIFKINPSLKKHIPAYFLGDTLEDAPGVIEEIIHKKQLSIADEWENPYRNLYELFEINLQTIYSRIVTQFSASDILGGMHNDITRFMSNSVTAALYFGNLDLLLPELHWMDGFLNNRHYGNDQAVDTWHIFSDSVHKVIGQEAAPLINWFELHLSK